MNTNIEPGCFAMVHGSSTPEDNGKIVKVLSFLDKEWYGLKNIWNIDVELTYTVRYHDEEGNIFHTEKITHYYAPEKNLMRIDGYKNDDEDITIKKAKDQVDTAISMLYTEIEKMSNLKI